MAEFEPNIFKYTATTNNWFVNVFLVETRTGVICIDSAISLSSANEIKKIIKEQIRKPLRAILLTHGHPDHYTAAGVIRAGQNIPIIATRGIREQCIHETEENTNMERYFGADFPSERPLPDQIISDGEILTFDDTVISHKDCGPCESDSDSIWMVTTQQKEHVFVGDLIFNKMHLFLRDGHIREWLDLMERFLKQYSHQTIFHIGHGQDCGIEAIYWQKAYIDAYFHIIKSMLGERSDILPDEIELLMERMRLFVPDDSLKFLALFEIEETIRLLKKSLTH